MTAAERRRHESTLGLLWRSVLLLRLPAGVVAVAAFLVSLVVHIASLGGEGISESDSALWFLHWGIFPLVVLATLTPAARAGRTLTFRELLASIPAPALAVIVLALIYLVASYVLLWPETGAGEPLVRDGRFFFNDHGVVREVTAGAFHLERNLTLRLYSGTWAYLYLVSAVLLLGTRRPQAKPQVQTKARKS
jgi:hypothetical protein